VHASRVAKPFHKTFQALRHITCILVLKRGVYKPRCPLSLMLVMITQPTDIPPYFHHVSQTIPRSRMKLPTATILLLATSVAAAKLKPGQKILLSEVPALTLRSDQMTKNRRVPAVSQVRELWRFSLMSLLKCSRVVKMRGWRG